MSRLRTLPQLGAALRIDSSVLLYDMHSPGATPPAADSAERRPEFWRNLRPGDAIRPEQPSHGMLEACTPNPALQAQQPQVIRLDPQTTRDQLPRRAEVPEVHIRQRQLVKHHNVLRLQPQRLETVVDTLREPVQQ